MNAATEVMKEANNKMSVLSMKTKLNVGFWNVCTMYETGTQAQVLLEKKQSRLHICILEICESLRKNTTGNGETIIFSGRIDNITQA